MGDSKLFFPHKEFWPSRIDARTSIRLSSDSSIGSSSKGRSRRSLGAVVHYAALAPRPILSSGIEFPLLVWRRYVCSIDCGSISVLDPPLSRSSGLFGVIIILKVRTVLALWFLKSVLSTWPLDFFPDSKCIIEFKKFLSKILSMWKNPKLRCGSRKITDSRQFPLFTEFERQWHWISSSKSSHYRKSVHVEKS